MKQANQYYIKEDYPELFFVNTTLPNISDLVRCLLIHYREIQEGTPIHIENDIHIKIALKYLLSSYSLALVAHIMIPPETVYTPLLDSPLALSGLFWVPSIALNFPLEIWTIT